MTIWTISDLHLFHANMLRGGKIGIRPFDTLDEMHERIIGGWNSVVRPNDKVYMLGDLTLLRDKNARVANASGTQLRDIENVTRRLCGKKRLLLGNHDFLALDDYFLLGFEKVLAYRVLAGMVFSHIPV